MATKTRQTVCLITRMGGPNFGSNLQAYALFETLKRQGYSVKLFSGIPCDFFGYPNNFNATYYLRLPLSLLGLYTCFLRLKLALIPNGAFPLASHKVNRWVRKHLPRKHIFFKWQLARLKRTESIFMVGSDQVWNTYVCFNPEMYLEFVDQGKRLSYATSVGTRTIKDDCKERVKIALRRFDRISVREKSAVTTLKNLTGREDIEWVLDPTFLITAEQWLHLSIPPRIPRPADHPYIFCYFLGEDDHYAAMLNDIRAKTGISDVIIVPLCKDRAFHPDLYYNYLNADPFEFVWLIAHAKIICTDSFHATALSINLNKEFVEFMRFEDSDIKSENSRIYDLLTHFNLMSCIYGETRERTRPTDFTECNRILDADRAKSLRYLADAIEG